MSDTYLVAALSYSVHMYRSEVPGMQASITTVRAVEATVGTPSVSSRLCLHVNIWVLERQHMHPVVSIFPELPPPHSAVHPYQASIS